MWVKREKKKKEEERNENEERTDETHTHTHTQRKPYVVHSGIANGGWRRRWLTTRNGCNSKIRRERKIEGATSQRRRRRPSTEEKEERKKQIKGDKRKCKYNQRRVRCQGGVERIRKPDSHVRDRRFGVRSEKTQRCGLIIFLSKMWPKPKVTLINLLCTYNFLLSF
jgi:hypothetical protein